MTTTKQIYVVVAASGDYEDYRERNIVAFADHATAIAFAHHAQEWGRAASAHVTSLDLDWDEIQRWRRLNTNPYDAEFEPSTYHPTRYSAQPVDWREGALAVTFKAKRFRKCVASLDQE